MRIILNGQQAFGKAALEKILEAGKDEVVGVFTAPDKEGRPPDPVKQAALEHNLPLFQPAGYKAEATLETMRGLNADLMVMAYVIIFIPEAARDIPKMGSICFHPSLLPLHRGPSSINWPIMWGASKTGFTWFYPTDGLDEGDILIQREVDIGPDDTLGDVYFKKIFPMPVSTASSTSSRRFVPATRRAGPRTTRRRPTRAGAVRRTSKSTGSARPPMSTI